MSYNPDPGDKVVCVNTDSPCDCEMAINCGDIGSPVIGRTYVALFTRTGYCENCGRRVPVLIVSATRHSRYAWPTSCFRRLRPEELPPLKAPAVPLVDA